MEWNEAQLESYVENLVEESLTLDYKAAGSLAVTDGKKKEITKDVSAMANSAGGVLIYGLKEYADPAKEHLAESIDPIDRTAITKEWLEQVITNIRPRIDGVVINPIQLSSGENHVAYVIEIPKGSTAHQATDHRYYKRFNFLSQPMEDYEIRDVMNRLTTPDAGVEFDYIKNSITRNEHRYALVVKIKNLGNLVINNFQLQFTFPEYDGNVQHIIDKQNHIDIWHETTFKLVIRYRSNKVLFPEEEIEVGREMAIQYRVNDKFYYEFLNQHRAVVDWTLHADSMKAKRGSFPFEKLQCF
jgi:hypothetical protein